MPVNKDGVGVEVNYTSDQDVNYLLEAAEDGTDFAVEFTGYLAEVYGHSKVKKAGEDKENDLYKAVITNGSKRIVLLIWGMDLIEKYFENMVPGKILHLDGCHGQIAHKKKSSIIKNVLNYEIIVQPSSILESKGFHVHSVKSNKAIPLIAFIDIAKASGEFQVPAHIKTVFAEAHNNEGPQGFASGSITEGTHKVPVQIKNFAANDAAHLTKGACILLKGSVRRSGKLTIICQNISSIQLLQDEEKLSEQDVSSANKPLKRFEPNLDKSTPMTKKLRIDSARCNDPSKENNSNNVMMEIDNKKQKSE